MYHCVVLKNHIHSMSGACKENKKEAYSRELRMVNNGTRISSRGHQIRIPASLVVVDSPKAIQKKRGSYNHTSNDHVNFP